MPLVDMGYTRTELDAREKGYALTSAAPEGPDYPWGLCLSLDDRDLKKLGISGTPGVGDEWHMQVVAKVTSVSIQSGPSNEDCRISLQITMAAIELKESAAEDRGEVETPASEAAETRRAGGVLGY